MINYLKAPKHSYLTSQISLWSHFKAVEICQLPITSFQLHASARIVKEINVNKKLYYLLQESLLVHKQVQGMQTILQILP